MGGLNHIDVTDGTMSVGRYLPDFVEAFVKPPYLVDSVVVCLLASRHHFHEGRFVDGRDEKCRGNIVLQEIDNLVSPPEPAPCGFIEDDTRAKALLQCTPATISPPSTTTLALCGSLVLILYTHCESMNFDPAGTEVTETRL